MSDAAYVFGDVEPDDAYVEGNVADDEQVGRRLHELRLYVERVAGRDGDDYDELTDDERTLAASIGLVIVRWIAGHEPDDATELAVELHNVRRYWTRGRLEPWDELDDDERALSVELMRAVIVWLPREGTP